MQGGEGCAWTRTHHNLPLGVIPTPLLLPEPKQAKQALRFPPQIIQDCIRWWSGTGRCYLCPPCTFRTRGRFPKNTLQTKLRTTIKSQRRTVKKLNERAGKKKHFREILVSKIPKKGTPEKCKLLRLKTNRALSCSCGMKTDDQGNSQ